MLFDTSNFFGINTVVFWTNTVVFGIFLTNTVVFGTITVVFGKYSHI